MNRQDLRLDERADETGLGEFRSLSSCFAQGQFSRIAEGLQHRNEVMDASGQAKPRRSVRLQ
ncbi:hypothetical protein ADK34_29755 [Streptomyces viridochromogenes]|uniref:Uncharacterized protein n=1 Tax=Streptomyces viridochromogenes TaxID=1938 RepID=A0A0L8JJX2_STRVR|nr:hypothetical protein ADK34_29755 [Streptomyces viridochromogenes]